MGQVWYNVMIVSIPDLAPLLTFTKIFVMSLDFAEIKNIDKMSIKMTYRTH